MKHAAFLLVFLSLSGCVPGVPTALTQPCKDWPIAPDGEIQMSTLLGLAADGKLAHADCQARYNALRKAVGE